MIIVRLMGGLGNQMFQYATARRLSYKHGAALRLDLSVYDNMHPDDTPRHFGLDHYKISGLAASKAELARMLPIDFQASLPYKIKRRLKLDKRLRPLGEANKGLNDIVLKARDNTYLVGWWQNEGYFLDIRDRLIAEFQPKKLTNSADNLARQIRNSEAVSIHVRRADYVTNKFASREHGLVPLSYYRKAVKLINDKVKMPRYFVFSDDITWCKKNLGLGKTTVFVEARDYEEIFLMSLCKYNIVANSSFSWWGAWLNDNPGKKVIAPKVWFQNKATDKETEIVPSSWIRL